MPTGPSTDWLQFVHSTAGNFVQHNRHLIRDQLISPHTQFPGLTFILGNTRKEAAVRYLFPENRFTSSRPCVQLRLDNRTIFCDHPLYFADCDLHLTALEVDRRSQDTEEIPIPWAAPTDGRILHILLARSLLLFVDVICIFADDVGGLEVVQAILTEWAALRRNASSLDYQPRVLVVAEKEISSGTHQLLDEADFLFELLQNPNVSEAFVAPSMLYLPSDTLSGISRYQPLKDELLKALDLSRQQRRQDGYLFSAAHLDSFFDLALQHACQKPLMPFDFVRSGRPDVPQRKNYASHLTRFLKLTDGREWADRAAFIASTILVDAYPQGAHRFSPATVFDAAYRDPCQDALVAIGMVPANCQLIEYHLARLYARLVLGQRPPRRVHEDNLAQWQALVGDIVSSLTCLGCLIRPPQHLLSCGQTYCDTCVARYGHAVEGTEYQYRIERCILCRSTCNNLINILPPTASVRAITIDGGGVRGFIPLRFLEHLQHFLGPQCPIQDLIDVAFGTSSGGLSVLKLFRQRRPVIESREAFYDLMVQFFGRHPRPQSTWAKIRRAFRCWWTDGWYNANEWDKLLQERFGIFERMFGIHPVSGTKVAVTTTADLPVLLVNYRRTAWKDDNERYYHVHEASDAEEEPALWQCARATTAAPGLFPPIDLPGIGSCEDGGLKYNCPARICWSETRSIWPSRSQPGTLVSLGTGKSAVHYLPGQNFTTRYRSQKRGFAYRLFDFWMASLDAHEAWRSFVGELEESSRQRCHRLDVAIPGQIPQLNSAGEVKWMTKLVDQVAKDQIRPALTSLLLTSLFFELASHPRQEDGRYHCVGVIRCRVKGEVFVDVVSRLHPHASAYLLGTDAFSASPYDDAVCGKCARYCNPIFFTVKELDKDISLSIKLDEKRVQLLGEFPRSLQWFIDQQGLNPIGHAERAPARTECKSCDNRIHRKRSSNTQSYFPYKRRVRRI